MGSSQSQEKPAEVLQKPSFVRTSASESAAVGEYTGPPRIRRLETFDEKLYRKLTTEPLIPIGCLVTAYYLTSGIRSFYQRDAARSQKMMRARVGAQFATLLIFIGYAGSSNIDWTLAPMYQQARKLQKEKQEKEEASAEQNSGSS